MTDTKLLIALESIGLREKEALVYYAALQLGPSTILKISKASGVKRSTVYSIIRSLEEKRLMKKALYGVNELFEAESPEHLSSLLEERQASFQKVLPQLSALHRLKEDESVVKHYEGMDRIKLLYYDMIKSVKIGEDYLVLSNLDIWKKHVKGFFNDFVQQRSRLDIKVRLIVEPSNFADYREKIGKQPNEKFRILPPETKLTTNLVIIPSKILIHQLEGTPRAMIIENQHIVRMHREMFELIWMGLH